METQKKWATRVAAPRAHKTLDQPQLSASPLPCTLTADVPERRIQCTSSPTHLCKRRPRSNPSDMKWAGSVQVPSIQLFQTRDPAPPKKREREVRAAPTWAEFSNMTPSPNLPGEEWRPQGREGHGKCPNASS